MKIHYKNVCSMRDAKVDFEPGKLICIRGETNQGKSAMFYSLLAGLVGNSAEFKRYINNEALKENPKAVAWIGITDDKGNLWQIEAGTGHFYYRANDVKYEKTQRKSLFELIGGQIPGLIYDPDNTTPIMNIVDEDTGFFPIDRSDSQIFKTYERLLSLSCTEDILRSIKLDTEEIDYKVSDMLKSIQTSQNQLTKFEEFYGKVDETKVLEIHKKLLELKDDYTLQIDLIDKTKSTSQYIKAVNSVHIKDREETFDIKAFQELLKALIRVKSDMNYITHCKYKSDITCRDFDIQNAIKLKQALDKASKLKLELAQLIYEIQMNESELKDIESILSTVKTCPYCHRPLEG